jgi:hypothetical protein
LALGVVCSSGPAQAAVFLNGVEVEGVGLSQKFEKCTVTFDGKGNVLIDAPGYTVSALTAPPPPGVGLTKKYFAIGEGGSVGGQVDLYVNAKWVQKFRVEDGQVVLEITKYVHPGPNQLLFVVKPGSIATPSAPKVIVGEGDASSNKVVIENALVRYPRPSSQSDATQEFTLNGR